MAAYYNEIDGYCAEWLRNLIAAGHLPRGDVDERDIREVPPDDLRPYIQCHFFGGVGGWPYALRLAGWPDDRECWTGSCPCQPLSSAGQRKGHADERHLWPAFYGLIAECRPAALFGEQVASRDGREWFAAVRADLEHLGYAVGAADLPAAGIGAPHIRQRLFFVAHTDRFEAEHRLSPERRAREVEREGAGGYGVPDGLADSAGDGRGEECSDVGGQSAGDRAQRIAAGLGASGGDLRPGAPDGFWRDADWLLCRDGKWRPVEPGTQPLAHGIPARVGQLRAYGNAINPLVAAAFVRAGS